MDKAIAYLDNAATTRPSEAALSAFAETATICYGNPSSLHQMGAEARAVLEDARGKVAAAVGARPSEVVFTSGGTEADNLAIQGACSKRPERRRIVISAVEHPAIYKVCRMLRKHGYEVEKVPVSIDGSFDEDALLRSVDTNTALVSFMTVNNETGTVFPIARIAELAKSRDAGVLVHTDAVQALGKVPLDANDMGVDLMTLSAHKVHGLKGCGALYVSAGVELHPVQFGGGQEGGLRSGTEPVPLMAAFGEAAREAAEGLGSFAAHARHLRDIMSEELAAIEGVTLNSDGKGAPHIVNASVPGMDAGELVRKLSDRGICVSRGAACKSNHEHGPSMLMSFGLPTAVADSALRMSLSRYSTEDDVRRLVDELSRILA